MSVIINANQVNVVIYKYLLQAGLAHTAYTMFNQAKLQSSLQQYKFDIKSGHLLGLIQKALLFSIIESHFHINQSDCDCIQPYSILKPHTCKIFQKKKKQYKNLEQQLNNNLNEAIKRTNAIYNTQLSNKNYDEIIYEPRGVNYFQKFKKLKFAQNQLQVQNEQRNKLKISSNGQNQIAFYNQQDGLIYLAQNDSFTDEIVIQKIYLCTLNGLIQKLNYFKLTPTNLIMVFESNQVKIINRQDGDKFMQINIPLKQKIISIQINPNFSMIMSFQSIDQYYVINIKNCQQITTNKGILKWRGYDEYVVASDQSMSFRSLMKQQPILQYKLQQANITQLQVSTNKTFFYISNRQTGKIYVYTFQKEQPLYIFDFNQENQIVKKILWIYRNQIDYLVILTDLEIKIWEVQLNSYCLKIQLQKYDVGQVLSLSSLQNSSSETFLLVLGSQNLLVSDVANQKIQRIQSPKQASQMQIINKNEVFLTTDQSVYFLSGQKMVQLFK